MDEHFDSNLGPMSCNPMGRAAAHGSGATPGAGVSGTDSGGPTGQAEARTRMGKRKRATGCSSNAEESSSVSGPPVSSDGTIQYEVPPGADISLERAPEEADKLLALFLELRGIARSAVRDTGLGFYFTAYGYGTPSERQDIMPQIEQELHECSMLKLVQTSVCRNRRVRQPICAAALSGQRQATASSDVPLFAGIGGPKYLYTFREALAG